MIDQKTIEQIAKLARLEVTADEAQGYAEQLSKILTHFQEISKIDTKNVQPLVTPVEIQFQARTDRAIKELSPAEILANAPEKAGHLFKVPPVI